MFTEHFSKLRALSYTNLFHESLEIYIEHFHDESRDLETLCRIGEQKANDVLGQGLLQGFDLRCTEDVSGAKRNVVTVVTDLRLPCCVV